MKIKIFLISIIVLGGLSVSAQYQIPLFAPGNTGGQMLDNSNKMLSVVGQNAIGITEDNSYRVYFGILAPLTVLATDVELKEKLSSRLLQNFPNPYRNFTTIPFELARQMKIKLKVTDILGQPVELILDQEMPQGRHNIGFYADELKPGLYFYQLEAEGHILVKTMVLTK